MKPPLGALALVSLAGAINAQATPGAPTIVNGTVYDSIARRPLAGVTVQFVSAAAGGSSGGRLFTAEADPYGRFTFHALPSGRYIAGFFHPALDSLGIEIGGRVVEVASSPQQIDLATPSPRTVIGSICPGEAISDSTAVLIGHVRESESESPVGGAVVAVEWRETVIDQLGIRERDQLVSARTQEPGWFAICGLPIDAVLYARAGRGADSTGHIEVELAGNELRHMTLHLGGGVRVVPGPVDPTEVADSLRATAPGLWTGSARLSGTVRDTAGRPIAAATVMVWGSGREAPTNDRGTFSIDGLPGGTHTLEVRLIGYVPIRRVVHLSEARPVTVDVVIGEKIAVLPTVPVRAQLVYSRQLVEFDRRRRAGFGQYLTPAEIERRPVVELGTLLQGSFGVYVQHDRGIATVAMRSRGRNCSPSIYVDGIRDMTGDISWLKSDMVAAIELYEREGLRPAEFMDRNPCGAIIVWTRPVPMRPRRRG